MYKKLFLASVLAVLVLASCSSRKDFIYLNDMTAGVGYPIDYRYEAVVHCGDRLSITVSCKNPELAIPFNIYGGSFEINNDGSVNATATDTREKGYRVDVTGAIDFPILGKLYVDGLKVSEVVELIKRRLIDGNYIKDPIVSIEFLNFKYTVLGAVSRNGTFTVEGDRITLIEAIANAGDLGAKADLSRVTVIREENGERKMYVNDIRSADIFKSPVFYLQQNDIVYVEPTEPKKEKSDVGWQLATIVLSALTATCSLLYVLKK